MHFLLASLAFLSWRHRCASAFVHPSPHSSTRHGVCRKSIVPMTRPFQVSTIPSQTASFRHRILRQESTAPDETSKEEITLDKERAIGILVLLSVPLSWGTYGPVVRYLYELQPPVPGFVFSAMYYMVASISLLLTLSYLQNDDNDNTILSEQETNDKMSLPIIGGFELGSYLFFANGLQIIGLQTVPADRAGFLVQLTTVMVPVVSAIFAGNLLSISMQTWLACVLAFAGVVVMGLDGKDAILLDDGISSYLSSTLTSFTRGDLLIVLAAFVYTLHVVRLGKYAKETTPLKLAASKATTEALFSVGLVLVLMAVGGAAASSNSFLAYAQDTGREISTFFTTLSNGLASGAVPTSAMLPALGATLWTGLVTCAYTIYAQSFGQRRVSPTEANLIYTVQPIFTALFAWALLGETLGPTGFVGAALIGSAVYIVAVPDDETSGQNYTCDGYDDSSETISSKATVNTIDIASAKPSEDM